MLNKKKVGRPPKVFKSKPKPDIKRSRGRPRKHLQEQNKINLSEIKKVPISFISNSIKKRSKIDNIALGLLVFSILLFIFSVSIRSNPSKEIIQDPITINNIQTEILENQNDNQQVSPIQQINSNQIQEEEELIYNFYKTINQRDFTKMGDMVDLRLKQSNSYRTYYNASRLTDFLNNISGNEIQITNLNQIPNPEGTAKKYEYDIKYKIKGEETLFTEKRNTVVVSRDNKLLIGSLMCVNQGCSKLPFFNPQRYGIK